MKFRIAIAFVFIAAITRLMPHPPNFTPIAAMGLFGAAYFNKKWLAYLVPFAALFLTDLFLNNVLYAQYFEGFAWITSPFIYLGFAAVIFAGSFLLKKVKAKNVLIASLTASVLFFVVTNFGSWLEYPMYPKDLTGLAAAFAAGIPFFPSTLLGDLVFSFSMFGLYEYAVNKRNIIAFS